MADRVRHQLFLPRGLSDRLETLAARPGASKSAVLVDALTAWLNRGGASELEDRFGLRLDRFSMGQGRLERSDHILQESIAVLARYLLAVLPPLAENDHAGRELAARRFEAFVNQVGKQVAAGRHTLGAESASASDSGE
ncbi:MAG: CopG family transcriptional regulator [Novosphingobium sp.]|nr:MAG: CopG family transcriptional regulator [Novosphingobium sp.]